MKSFKNFFQESRKETYSLDDLDRVKYPSRDTKFSRRKANKRKMADEETGVEEASVATIDKKIDRQIDRHKNIQGKEPRHNKQKERVRDGIERLRNRRNRLTGNPKSEPVEQVEESIGSELQEVLTVAQRRKRGIIMKRNKAKLRVGRRKASRRIADKGRLDKRARRQARNTVAKRLTKGKNKRDLSPARKAEIERRLSKMSGIVGRVQKRVLPVVRRRDRSR